jgi:methionyl-tRNA formyltransferase
LKVLFYGTPAFSLPTLDALIDAHRVVAVVTQPDRPAGRGQHVATSPVKTRAVEAGLPILQPRRLRDPEWVQPIRALGADVAVVVAYGQILPGDILRAPARGSINVHASLLPRYRGAAPIAWALIEGETRTGITTFRMDEGMDTGPILLQSAVPILPGETAGALSERLALLGSRVLLETLDRLDTLVPTPQRDAEATFAPRLKKRDGEIDWRWSARAIVNRVHGCNPWPGAATVGPTGRLTIWLARVGPPHPGSPVPAGTLVAGPSGILVAAGEDTVEPVRVQPESRRAMTWLEYLRGARLGDGDRLGQP